jgi:hypothetical protein
MPARRGVIHRKGSRHGRFASEDGTRWLERQAGPRLSVLDVRLVRRGGTEPQAVAHAGPTAAIPTNHSFGPFKGDREPGGFGDLAPRATSAGDTVPCLPGCQSTPTGHHELAGMDRGRPEPAFVHRDHGEIPVAFAGRRTEAAPILRTGTSRLAGRPRAHPGDPGLPPASSPGPVHHARRPSDSRTAPAPSCPDHLDRLRAPPSPSAAFAQRQCDGTDIQGSTPSTIHPGTCSGLAVREEGRPA